MIMYQIRPSDAVNAPYTSLFWRCTTSQIRPSDAVNWLWPSPNTFNTTARRLLCIIKSASQVIVPLLLPRLWSILTVISTMSPIIATTMIAFSTKETAHNKFIYIIIRSNVSAVFRGWYDVGGPEAVDAYCNGISCLINFVRFSIFLSFKPIFFKAVVVSVK